MPRGKLYCPQQLPSNSWWTDLLDQLHQRGLPAEQWSKGKTALVGRAISRYGLHFNLRRGRRAVLHPTAWASSSWLFPRGIWHEPVVCAMDCWESEWDRWEKLLRRNRVRTCAFTARQSMEEMQRRLPHLQSIWLPEAIDHQLYIPGPPLSERQVDVLEMGRRYEAFHDAARPVLADAGRNHVYPKTGQHYMFRDHAEIRETLADTRLMVCYPRCDTHPEQAGGVDTLTLRFLEGFASGCVVIGRAPQELIDLFGYNPVVPIDIDAGDVGQQVLHVLDHLDDHQPLVERNHARVREAADWGDRAVTLLKWLDSLGYALPEATRAQLQTPEESASS